MSFLDQIATQEKKLAYADITEFTLPYQDWLKDKGTKQQEIQQEINHLLIKEAEEPDEKKATLEKLRAEIDNLLTSEYPKEKRQSVVFQEPSPELIYQIGIDAAEIGKKLPELPQQGWMDIATLAICHAEPMLTTSKAEFYVNLSKKSPGMFLYLLSHVALHFPYLRQNNMSDADLKNALCGSALTISTATRSKSDTSPES
jgi:hypothetical protein